MRTPESLFDMKKEGTPPAIDSNKADSTESTSDSHGEEQEKICEVTCVYHEWIASMCYIF